MASFQHITPTPISPWTTKRLRRYVDARVINDQDTPTILERLNDSCDAMLLAQTPFELHLPKMSLVLNWVDAPTSAIQHTTPQLAANAQPTARATTQQRALEMAVMEVLCRLAMTTYQSGINWNVPLAMQGLRAVIEVDADMLDQEINALIVEQITTELPTWLNAQRDLAATLVSRIRI